MGKVKAKQPLHIKWQTEIFLFNTCFSYRNNVVVVVAWGFQRVHVLLMLSMPVGMRPKYNMQILL